MTRTRLVEYHLQRLQDKRPETRLDAIRELVLLDAVEALEALQDVFAHDSDPRVLKAAQQAGRSIFRLSVQSKSAS